MSGTAATTARRGTDLSGDQAADLAYAKELDHEAIGFMCGLEIHQQLDTRKLYSPCPGGVVDPDTVKSTAVAAFDRRLRATQSEMGELDVAAVAEAKKRRSFRYLAIEGHTSLVETDDEPPHPISEDALDVTLTFAGLVAARPAAEVHTMRKTVIDGSNTGGFQRTALIATGGTVDAEDGDVGVWTIAVEEDSARKLSEEAGKVTYTLDRLGIPLIEIATAPDIKDPQHAKQTASRIGALLRATGRVRRGLGSIRQDLNVSIGVGTRVEIKGCQDLRAVPQVIDNECRRQLWLHHVAEELAARGFQAEDAGEPVDVSDAFAACDSKIVKGAFKGKGKVYALALPKWAGLIGGREKDGPRLGREFADHGKVAAGVRGVFHSDELPAYGITENEVAGTRAALGLGDQDGFVLCVERPGVAREALEAVRERAVQALAGVAGEVRAAQPDDATRYMRPLPGAARMYPETDVPPTRITTDRWQHILETLPARPEEKVAELVQAHGLSQDQATQLVREGEADRFEDLVQDGAEPKLCARVLLQTLPDLERPETVAPRLAEVFTALAEDMFAKEAVPQVLAAIEGDPDRSVKDAASAAGAEGADEGAVEQVVQDVVGARIDFVKERGPAAMGPLMGPVMAELRGKADGQLVSRKLKEEIDRVLAG